MRTATLTDLLRTPKDVLALADEGAVRITRRDAADLVVMRAGDLELQEEGIGLASRLMRAALACQGDMPAAVRRTFAWASLLSEDGVGKFAAEMDRLLWSAAELGHYEALLAEFRSWEGTAEAIAAGMPEGTGEELTPIDTPADVERP